MDAIDHIELYVANLKKSLHFYQTHFNFRPIAYLNHKDASSILIQLNAIRLILTAPKHPESEVANFIRIHGDGVKNVAFLTSHYTQNVIQVFGDITHTFIPKTSKQSDLPPHFIPIQNQEDPPKKTALTHIDHLAICVYPEEFTYWISYYQNKYQFDVLHKEYLVTPQSGMNSCALVSKNKQIKLVFVTPIDANTPSQVTSYLEAFRGPGIQHIAFSTPSIISSVQMLRHTGLEFLAIPKSYYDIQKNNLKTCTYPFELLQGYEILIDKTEEGFLYQVFSKTTTERPTLFFEIIERAGCHSFGSNNIKALFQAIEGSQ